MPLFAVDVFGYQIINFTVFSAAHNRDHLSGVYITAPVTD